MSKHGRRVSPGRHAGVQAQGEDGEPFEEKVRRLTAHLRQQTAKARRLDEAIW